MVVLPCKVDDWHGIDRQPGSPGTAGMVYRTGRAGIDDHVFRWPMAALRPGSDVVMAFRCDTNFRWTGGRVPGRRHNNRHRNRQQRADGLYPTSNRENSLSGLCVFVVKRPNSVVRIINPHIAQNNIAVNLRQMAECWNGAPLAGGY